MMNEEKAIILEKLAQNKDFLYAVANANSKDELQSVFCGFGLEMNREEIDAFIQMMDASVSDELGEEALDNVSGGVDAATIFSWAWKGAKAVAKTAWNLGRKLANWEKSL